MKFMKYFLAAKATEMPDRFEIWLKALGFAKEAHAGQLIPGTDLPYFLHPAAVSDVLKPCLTDANAGLLIPIALLHDTIEDTKVTHADLVREFGQAVADGVAALSKDPSLPKEQRMPDSLKRIQAQPRAVWMVKMADRIVNMSPPPNFWSDRKIAAYKEEARLILTELRSADEYLAKILEEKIQKYPYR
jgi:(p)ppGpp synthase/HD superfamily hydrolase